MSSLDTQDCNAKPTSVIAYGSKSSPDENDSTTSQVEHVERKVEQVGGREIVATFTEENVSGFSGDRGPELQRAIEAAVAAADQHESELWVFHSSRLARGSGKKGEARALAKLYWDLRAEGVAIRSVEDDEFCTNPQLIGIASEQNHQFSKAQSSHIRRGLRETLQRGERGGGPIPDGYEVLRELIGNGPKVKRTWRLDPERAPIIQLAFSLAEQGMGDGSVAKELNRLGHRTKGGRPWERSRIQSLLGNYWYSGRVAKRGEGTGKNYRRLDEPIMVDGEHPALVAPETFDKLLAMRALRDPAAGSERVRRGRPFKGHALAELAQCAACGEPMRPQTTSRRRKDGSRWRRYRCVGCGVAVNAELIDTSVVANLDRFLGDFAAWTAAIESGQQGERERLAREVERADSDLAAAEKRVGQLEANYEEELDEGNGGNAKALLPLLERRRAEVERTTKRLAAAREALEGARTDTPADQMLDFYASLRDAVKGRLDKANSLSKVNDALNDLFDRFELTSTDAGVEVKPVLSQATAARIIDGLQAWPHGIQFAGRDVVREEQTGALISFGEPEESALFEGAEVAPRPAPTLTAKHAQTPPLRAIEVPAKKFTNSLECWS